MLVQKQAVEDEGEVKNSEKADSEPPNNENLENLNTNEQQIQPTP